jgi:hypothetical protein
MRTGRSGTQPCAMASPGRQRAKRVRAIRRSMGVLLVVRLRARRGADVSRESIFRYRLEFKRRGS